MANDPPVKPEDDGGGGVGTLRMSNTFDPEAHCDHMAAVLGLEIRAEWRQSVVDNLKATQKVAEAVLSFPLADAVEPAPIFEP